MESIDPAVQSLHSAYCQAMACEANMTASMERWWRDAAKEGLDADMLRLVIHERRKRITTGVRNKECLYIRNLAGSEDAIADTVNEAAVIRAAMRVKVMPRGRADVLQATGRNTEAELPDAKPIGEVIEALRKAAG